MLVGLVVWLGMTSMAAAQSPGSSGRIELGAGVGWASGYDLGSSTAELVRNQVTSSMPFPLFTTASRIHSTSAVGAWIGVKVTPALAIEGRLSRGRPTFRTVVSGDDELLTTTSAEERLTRYELDASVIWHLTRAAFRGGRGMPYVGGGAGYLRELHEGRVAIETGRQYHAAAGVKYRLFERQSAAVKALGVRGEVRMQIRDGGVDLEDTRRRTTSVSIGLFIVL